MSKNITPHQMRKGLAYVHQGPDFMKMLTGQSATSDKNPYKKPIGIEAKFQTEGGDDDDDDDDTAHDILNEREEERPTVVVLKDGKHLDERQVKNILKNLPAGLSEAEIQKRLAEGMTAGKGKEAKGGASSSLSTTTAAAASSSSEDENDDTDYADGKVRYHRPKGSKAKSKTGSLAATDGKAGSKRSFEEIMLSEAQVKMKELQQTKKAGGTSQGIKEAKALSTPDTDTNKKKVKKQKTAKAKVSTLLLSFDDEE
ncbi:hypothetical protein BGZ94_010072 [Podila epigama]|nr:hypothetical protein BGZ94_010072 [Podila epigama]